MKRVAFHPPLFAAFPVLSLYSANLALVPYKDVWHPLLFSVIGAFGLWLIAALIFRNINRGAIVASVITGSIFAYSKIVSAPNESTARTVEIGAWLVLLAVLLFVFVRKSKKGDWQTPALNIVGSALMLSSVGSITFGLIAAKKHVGEITHSAEQASGTAAAGLPDIFYIILDGYGREDQLKRVFGFDNSDFTKELQSRGFYVASGAHSNYCQTELSLPSSLNFDLIQNLLPKIDREEIDRSPLDSLVIDNRVSRHLKSKGYRTVSITSGFPAFDMAKSDLWFHAPLSTTLFEDAVLQLTPLSLNHELTGSLFTQRRMDLLGAFGNLADQSQRSAAPRFVFVHILMPHPPFTFDANGNSQRFEKLFGYWDGSHYYMFGGTKDEYHRGYTGQVTYLDKRMLPLIDGILKQTSPKPIILIQGDHGSKMGLNQDYIEKTDLNECFSNLSAYYLPPDIKAKLYPSITPVNSFRLIFNGLFGEKWPLLPDQSWYSPIGTPYHMTEVTDRLIKTPQTAMR